MKTTTTIQEIRRSNLRLLIDESPERTTVSIARKCDINQSYLSQILIRYKMESGKPREMGTDLARKLERGCGKSEGWMDAMHGPGEGDIDPAHSELVHLYSNMDDKMRAVLMQQARMMAQIGK